MVSDTPRDPDTSEEPDYELPGQPPEPGDPEPYRTPDTPGSEPTQPLPQPGDPAPPRYTVPREVPPYLYLAMNF